MAVPVCSNPQFVAPAAADSLSLTPSSSAWISSSWVELVAATAAAWVVTGLVVRPEDNAAYSVFEIDIGVGGSGSEVVVDTFRGTFANTHYASPGVLPRPIGLDHIASGARVSLRMRKNTTSTVPWTVKVGYYAKPLVGTLLTSAQPQKAYPPAANDIQWTIGASAWANSSWTQMVAATEAAIVLVGLVAGVGFGQDSWEFDIGIGAAASEVVLTTVRIRHQGIQFVDGPFLIPFFPPLDAVPNGSRLSVRTRVSDTTLAGALGTLVYVPKPL